MSLTKKEVEARALELAQELSELVFKRIEGDSNDDGALRILTLMTLSALVALVTTRDRSDKFYSTLRRGAEYFDDVIELVAVEAYKEHQKVCPAKVKH